MSWGAPELLYALWALPIAVLLVWLALRSRRRALLRLGALVPALASQGTARVHRFRLAGAVVVGVLGIFALAQPRYGFRWEELKREGLSLVVVLDVSSSMDAADVSPSRMERASRKIQDLADLLEGDRVGLVLFAGGAYPRMPLTLDYNALRQMVKDSNTSTLAAQGSDLGAGIDAAVKLLGDDGPADRAILLVSDGEDQVGQAVDSAKKAAEKGVHLYTLGVGTPDGAPIPLADGGFKKDKGGQVVLTKLDEDTLKAIASAGGGAYVRAAAGSADIQSLYEDEIRGKLKSAEQGTRRDKIWDERYQWPLGIALILGIGTALIRPGALRLGGVATLLFASLAFGTPARAADAPAKPAAASTQDPEVAKLLQEQTEHPNDLSVSERLGGALYKAKDYARAEEVLQGLADRTLDPEQKARARYNAGLSAYKGGRLTDAVQDWQRVLQDKPDDHEAAQNAAAAQKELQLRMKQQPPPQDKQNQDQSQQNQQQKQDQENQQQSQDQQNQAQNQDKQGQNSQSQQQDQNQQKQQDQSSQQQAQAQKSDGTRKPGQQDTGDQQQAQQAQAAQQGQGDTGQQAQAAQQGDGEQTDKPGTISPQEAGRLVDGVKEGDPRVVINPASRGGKDW